MSSVRQLSLRARLVALTIIVSMVLVVIVAAVSLDRLGAQLLDRIDNQVVHAVRALPNGPPTDRTLATSPPSAPLTDGDERPGQPPGPGGPGDPNRSAANLPPGSWVGVITTAGQIRRESLALTRFDRAQGAAVEASYRPADLRAVAATPAMTPVTVDRHGGGHLRIITSAAAGTDLVVVAVPLDDYERTLSGLLRIELLALVIGLLIASLAAWLLVTRSLRPLSAIAAAADRIAHDGSEHDPTQPLAAMVPGADGPSEVAQVSGALSAMLARITELFQRQHETEAQLRRLVGDASHELRTPITAMRGHAELIAKEHARMDAEQLERSSTRIAATAQHLGHLVDQLLDLARLDERFGTDVTDIDLRQIAAAAVDDARAADAEHPLITLTDGPPVPLRGDATAVRQLLDNLLANERAHTPAGTSVQVAIDADTAGAESARITVSDDGPGMPAEDMQRATDRFWRGSNTRAGSASSGAGLGLAIVASIAEAHRGSVRLSRPATGSGLVITVELSSLGV